MTAAYLAPPGLGDQLQAELAGLGRPVRATHGDLLLADGPAVAAAWAANVWQAPREIPIESIKDGAARLRAIQRNWSMYAPVHGGRAKLIQGELPHVSAKPLVFPAAPPAAALGAWTLLAPNLILASPACSSPVPNGDWQFVEDREGPPNRAYLKLWEAFTRLGRRPGPGDLCLDLGASPGGWTWVMANLGAQVVAVDKADLDPRVARLPGVSLQRESAFGLDERSFERVDWLCSDIICYPARLLKLVQRWMAAGRVRNYVCTLKFQGETDHETARAFAAIPGSQLFHLSNNKHELTWALLAP